MNEVKLLLRDIFRLRIVARISPISAHITLARGRTRMCLKISTRFDTYLSRSPGLYGFPTTSAEIDFLPAAGQPMFCGYSGSPFDGDRWGKESGLLCDAKCPNIGFNISTRIQQQGLFREPDHHQINPPYGHMTSKKKTGWQRLKEQLTDDSISIFSDIVRSQTSGMEQRVLVCNSERESDGIELKQEHRIHASA